MRFRRWIAAFYAVVSCVLCVCYKFLIWWCLREGDKNKELVLCLVSFELSLQCGCRVCGYMLTDMAVVE